MASSVIYREYCFPLNLDKFYEVKLRTNKKMRGLCPLILY